MDFRLTAGLSGYSRLNGNTCEEEQSICWRLAVRSCTGLVMSTMAHDMLFRGLVWHVHAAGASTSGPPGHSFSTCLPLFMGCSDTNGALVQVHTRRRLAVHKSSKLVPLNRQESDSDLVASRLNLKFLASRRFIDDVLSCLVLSLEILPGVLKRLTPVCSIRPRASLRGVKGRLA